LLAHQSVLLFLGNYEVIILESVHAYTHTHTHTQKHTHTYIHIYIYTYFAWIHRCFIKTVEVEQVVHTRNIQIYNVKYYKYFTRKVL